MGVLQHGRSAARRQQAWLLFGRHLKHSESDRCLTAQHLHHLMKGPLKRIHWPHKAVIVCNLLINKHLSHLQLQEQPMPLLL